MPHQLAGNGRLFRPISLVVFLLLALSLISSYHLPSASSTIHSTIPSDKQDNTVAPSTLSSSTQLQARSETPLPSTRGDQSALNLAGPSSSPVTYNGGPIQVQQNIYLIFWLPAGQHFEPSGNDTNFESLITRYFNDIGGSQFYSLLEQYPDSVDGSPSTAVHLAGAYIDSSPYPKAGTQADPLIGQNIFNEVQKYIASGSLPVGIDNEFYVFTAHGIKSCQDSTYTICSFSTSASSGYCAYHSYFYSGSSDVTYADMGDNPGTSGCMISLSTLGSSAYPNKDGIADSEISLASQEQFDTVSDPLFNAWYDTSRLDRRNQRQMRREVTGLSTQPTDTTSFSTPTRYIVQQEWSNSAGSCTLSPPATASVQITLSPAGGVGSLSASNYFQITFAIGKQQFVANYEGTTMQFATDVGTTLSIAPLSSASNSVLEKWCLDLSCQGYTLNIGTGSQNVILGYYDLLQQSVFEIVAGGGQPSSPDTLSYYTAPLTIGASTSPVATTVTLSSSSQSIWAYADLHSIFLSRTQAGSSSQERWYTSQQSMTVTQPDQISAVLSAHQYLATYGYNIIGGSTGSSPPSVLYFTQGQPVTTSGGSSQWTDAGTEYYFPPTLPTSSVSARWAITPGTGVGIVNSPTSLQITYYQQYNVSVSYSIVNGTGNAPVITFSAKSFGVPISFGVNNQSPTSNWVDAGSNYLLPICSPAPQRQNAGTPQREPMVRFPLLLWQFLLHIITSTPSAFPMVSRIAWVEI